MFYKRLALYAPDGGGAQFPRMRKYHLARIYHPMTDQQRLIFPIYDKDRNAYQLCAHEDEQHFLSHLVGDDGPAGQLNIKYASLDEWVIADLVLFAEAPKTVRSELLRWLRDFGLWKPKTIDYRWRGLGTTLLAFVEERAQLRQVQRVTGYVVRRDYEGWPKLLDWYERRGYTVTRTPAINKTGSGTDEVARIGKEL